MLKRLSLGTLIILAFGLIVFFENEQSNFVLSIVGSETYWLHALLIFLGIGFLFALFVLLPKLKSLNDENQELLSKIKRLENGQNSLTEEDKAFIERDF